MGKYLLWIAGILFVDSASMDECWLLAVFVCVCVCMYICMYLCVYGCMYVCMYVWMFVYIYIYKYTYIHAHIYIYIHTHTHTHTCSVCVYTNACINTNMCAHICICIALENLDRKMPATNSLGWVSSRSHVCVICARMHVHARTWERPARLRVYLYDLQSFRCSLH